MKNANDNLSRAMSIYTKWQRRQYEIGDELDSFYVPSEYHTEVFDKEDERINTELAPLGFNIDTLAAAVVERCNIEVAYEYGLSPYPAEK